MIELSQVEGYEGYKFDLGDITYIQDTEYFGWTENNGIKTPYKEEIVITEMHTYFNSPEKNTIVAKNYRESFEDLFQRMAASSQQLQFNAGSYKRAADVVDTEGNIAPAALSEAFANNAYVLSNIANQSVKWDERGITTTNTIKPNDIVRITSGGIYLTEDGGDTWTTGISAGGINAKTITTGKLNTGAVTIMNGERTAFRWDESGINAFAGTSQDGEYKQSYDKYVRLDEYGLYGIDGEVGFDPREKDEGDETGIEKINKRANFALTWDGFVLNSTKKGNKDTKVKISNTDDIQVFNYKGEELIKIGRLDGENSAGMRINVSGSNNEVIIGDTGYADITEANHGKLIFKAGPFSREEDGTKIDDAPFRVYEDGFVYAGNAQIGGDMAAVMLRKVRINTSYVSNLNGSGVILECQSTIPTDELEVTWKGWTEGKSGSMIELSYDNVVDWFYKYASDGKPKEYITIIATVKINGEVFEPGTPLYASSFSKVVVDYASSKDGTNPPKDGWTSDLPSATLGYYTWTRTTTSYIGKEPDKKYSVVYHGKDGLSVSDLTLKADTLVFVLDENNNLSPSQIDFTALAENLEDKEGYTWTNITNNEGNNSNYAHLSAEDFQNGGLKPITVSVEYAGRTDSITIQCVKDGKNAVTVSLDNPVMTFQADRPDQKETTTVKVYIGSTEIGTNPEDGRYFEISGNQDTIAGNIITITNPKENITYEYSVDIHHGEDPIESYYFSINCLVNGPTYIIDLSNDSATIGVNEGGEYTPETLERLTETTVTVLRDGEDVTENCFFRWQAQNGSPTRSETEDYKITTNSLKVMTEDSATLTVDVYLKEEDENLSGYLGQKTLTVTKVYQGQAAVSYKLIVSPTSINLDDDDNRVYFTIEQIHGGGVSKVSGGNYKIKIGNQEVEYEKENRIRKTTTFDLYVNDELRDRETVSVVGNGEPGEPGEPGKPGKPGDVGPTVSVEYWYQNSDSSASPPRPTNGNDNGWSSSASSLSAGKPFQHRIEREVVTQGENISYGDWRNPVVVGYYGSDAVVDDINVFNVLTQNSTKFGCFYGEEDENKVKKLYINANFIKSGIIDTDHLNVSEIVTAKRIEGLSLNMTQGKIGGWTISSSGLDYNQGGVFLDPEGRYLKVYEDYGVSAHFGINSYFYVFDNGNIYCNTIYNQSSMATSSDANQKNSIQELDEHQEELFNKLKPVTYKYNNGTSGRTHTGFIAQDVCTAIEASGLSTKDFAGYIVASSVDPETGERKESCYLRYEEFISLNTWQIQKLKPRMTAAEQEIESLKSEIEQLRAELNSLK